MKVAPFMLAAVVVVLMALPATWVPWSKANNWPLHMFATPEAYQRHTITLLLVLGPGLVRGLHLSVCVVWV